MPKAAVPANEFSSIEDFEEQAAEALGIKRTRFVIALPGQDPFVIPHPFFLSDERADATEAVQNRKDLDRDDDGKILETIDGEPAGAFRERYARAVLGDSEFERFIAAGGKSNTLNVAFQWFMKEFDADDPK